MTISYNNTASLSTMSAEDLDEIVSLNLMCDQQHHGINPKYGISEMTQDYANWFVPRSTSRVLTAHESGNGGDAVGAILLLSTKESRAVADSPELAAWFGDNDVDINKCCIPHIFVSNKHYNKGIAQALFTGAEELAVSLGFEDWILYGAFKPRVMPWFRRHFEGRWSPINNLDGVRIDPIPGDAQPGAVRVRLV